VGAGAVGVRKTGASEAVTVRDQFHIGSNTKAMTATLAGMLVEEGKLQWTQTLAEVFPERADKMTAAYREVTLEMLLTHRSGMPANQRSYGTPIQSVSEQRLVHLDAVLATTPAFQPGTEFSYSNAGYIVAGTMLERIANKAWEDLMRDRLFAPLEMKSAGFGPPSRPNETDQPWGHVLKAGKFEPAFGDNPAALGPAGTVHCNLEDYLKFADLHAGAGSKRSSSLLKAETLMKLQTADTGRTYAMGWGTGKRDWAKGRVLSHSGSNTMNYFVAWIAPEIEFAMAVATNAAGPDVPKILDQVCGLLVKRFSTSA
jgi:CubicO group peptidase (beta-lactamase class C family)